MPGIQESKELIAFTLKLGNGLGASLEDGKLSFTDAPKFMDAMMAAPAAFQGISEVPAEMKDLDEAEKAELIAYAKTEFDIPQDKVEELVEEGLSLAIAIYNFVEKVRA